MTTQRCVQPALAKKKPRDGSRYCANINMVLSIGGFKTGGTFLFSSDSVVDVFTLPFSD